MSNMLTEQDLQAIGKIVEDKIKIEVPPIVETIVKRVVDTAIDDPEGVINTKFDAMQEQLNVLETKIDSVENRMLTRHDLERYEDGLTTRLDQRYVRKPVQSENASP